MAQNRYSLRKEIFWKIPEHERTKIEKRARIHIDDTPMEVLECIAMRGVLKFDENIIFHIEESVISGINAEGWGIPSSIACFRTAWLQQLVNKADQAVAIDYTLGMRVISPAPTPGGTDPMASNGMGEFTARMSAMIQTHRNNPASYHTAPFPLQYQFMGGEGAALIPPDKLKFRHQEFLNQLGVPLEYHQMNMTAQAAPMALRMFESYWQNIPAFYNNVLSWTVKILTKTFDLDETRVEMQKTTVVDDMQYKQILLQLMGGNQLSPQTALEPLGIDAATEVEKVLKHQDFVERATQKYQEKAKKREEMGVLKGMVQQPTASALQGDPNAAPAGAPVGGMPMGGMPGLGQTAAPASLAEMSEQAGQIAQQIVSIPEFERKQQLRQLREGNKELHALVKSDLEKLRSEARSQGAAQLAQPPPGGQQGGAR